MTVATLSTEDVDVLPSPADVFDDNPMDLNEDYVDVGASGHLKTPPEINTTHKAKLRGFTTHGLIQNL